MLRIATPLPLWLHNNNIPFDLSFFWISSLNFEVVISTQQHTNSRSLNGFKCLLCFAALYSCCCSLSITRCIDSYMSHLVSPCTSSSQLKLEGFPCSFPFYAKEYPSQAYICITHFYTFTISFFAFISSWVQPSTNVLFHDLYFPKITTCLCHTGAPQVVHYIHIKLFLLNISILANTSMMIVNSSIFELS